MEGMNDTAGTIGHPFETRMVVGITMPVPVAVAAFRCPAGKLEPALAAFRAICHDEPRYRALIELGAATPDHDELVEPYLMRLFAYMGIRILADGDDSLLQPLQTGGYLWKHYADWGLEPLPLSANGPLAATIAARVTSGDFRLWMPFTWADMEPIATELRSDLRARGRMA